jgi:hypothetical protein
LNSAAASAGFQAVERPLDRHARGSQGRAAPLVTSGKVETMLLFSFFHYDARVWRLITLSH